MQEGELTKIDLTEYLAREKEEHAKTKTELDSANAQLKLCLQILSNAYGVVDNISSNMVVSSSALVQLKQQMLDFITKKQQQS